MISSNPLSNFEFGVLSTEAVAGVPVGRACTAGPPRVLAGVTRYPDIDECTKRAFRMTTTGPDHVAVPYSIDATCLAVYRAVYLPMTCTEVPM
ncbi:hypothetical protein LshimejAT787_0202220 [Lyophyllum shimeji]|uniref:Uncharacterized protein n=1 Tax=Lyophyllum shimeji TaxID=47721 RepID=A0A9P3PEU4_LYOSH|nr:hypothetical protein LshimejAT787_0202220 [Lyophyllum shimeji]